MEPTFRDDEVRVQQVYEAVLRDGDIAIDVGAHTGRHCLPMANQVFPSGHVYAFEPLPMCRDSLADEISRCFPELAPTLSVLPQAVGAEVGEAEFYVARDDLPYSGLRPRIYLGRTRLDRLQVPVATLDSLFLDLPSLRLIKVDVEGGEYHVLKGAVGCLRKFRPVVVFEFGNLSIVEYGITSADLAELLGAAKYTICGIQGKWFAPEEFLASAQKQDIHDYVAVPAEDRVLQRTIFEVLANPRPAWQRVALNLGQAERFVRVGTEVPPLPQFRGLKRWLARGVARLVLFLAQAVTRRQRAFNRSMLLGARAQLYVQQDFDRRLAALEGELARRDTYIQELEKMICSQV